MKFLTTSEDIANEVNRLIPVCQCCWVAVAWASVGFEAFELLVKHQHKIARMVVGTEFYQTHPEFVKVFLKQATVRFLLRTDGLFHPKAYLFELADGRWECIVGSANFTSGGFGLNSEIAVLVSSTDAGAEVARTQFLSAMEAYWSQARTLCERECEAYAEAWEQKQPAIKRLQGHFGDPAKPADDTGKPPLEIPILQMSWQEYLEKVTNERMPQYGLTVEQRVTLIEFVQELFRSHSHFNEIDKEARQRIAGTCGLREGIDFGFFGGMSGAGKFKNAINENSQHVSQALDLIPAKGEVTRNEFIAFVSEYKRAFPSGGCGIGTVTRLLAMKRPDVFVCLDDENKLELCKAFKIPRTVDFERYWDSVIERIREARWWLVDQPSPGASKVERVVWAARAAFLDSLYYNAGIKEFCTSFCIVLPDGAEVLPYREETTGGENSFHVLEQGVSREEAIPVGDEDELRQYVFDLNCKVQCKQRDGFRRTFYSPLPPNQLRELPEL